MKHFYFLFSLTFCLLSCNTNEELDAPEISGIDTNFVDMRYAISTATLLEFGTKTTNGMRSSVYRDIDESNIKPIGSTEKPSYYVINYQDGGWVIIAADKRVEPIMAYSDEGYFDLNQKELPGGLLEWLMDSDTHIQKIRESEEKLPDLFSAFAAQPCMLKAISPGDDCTPIPQCESKLLSEVGPLLKTEWHQRGGFNDLVTKFCDNDPTGRAPAGCVAIAIAQVMNYHKIPNSYNWNMMHPYYGGSEASRLIRDIGYLVEMDYDCDGSGANMNNAVRTLQLLGHPTSVKKNYNVDTNLVKRQLHNKLPVILRGAETDFWSFLGRHGEGHAWVCDGFTESQICLDTSTHLTLKFHMNWGWGRDNGNGWFGYAGGDWKGYTKGHEIIYNIGKAVN